MLKNQKGFTLIELLIVIVIIGILAGVLIAIINPAQQQNRARDANVKASMNKVALATEGFISAYGRTPNDTEFLSSLSNSEDSGVTTGADSCAAGDRECLFTISGNELPVGGTVGCLANGWNGSGANQCFYRYYADTADPTHFRIYAKSFGIPNVVFMYDNSEASIQDCVAADVDDVDINPATGELAGAACDGS